jgi:hypothetical protein
MCLPVKINACISRTIKMRRKEITNFQDIPNIGPAIEKDLALLGIKQPIELAGKDPYKMYEDLCRSTQTHHDPCVLDVFISAVSYMKGGPAKKWWEFTKVRKKTLAGR